MKEEPIRFAEPEAINKILAELNQFTNKQAERVLKFCLEYIEDRL